MDEDDEEEDDVDQLIRQNQVMEKPTAASETQREDVVNQKRLYDTAMDIRVKLQGMMRVVNAFPPPAELTALAAADEAVQAELDRAERNLSALLAESAELLGVVCAQAGCPWAGDADPAAALAANARPLEEFYVGTLEAWHSKVTVMNLSKFSQEQNVCARRSPGTPGESPDVLTRRASSTRSTRS